jgi:hypothetical protein
MRQPRDLIQAGRRQDRVKLAALSAAVVAGTLDGQSFLRLSWTS